MGWLAETLDSYSFSVYGGDSNTEYRLILKGEGGLLCYLYFRPDAAGRQTRYSATSNRATVYYNAERFQPIVDLLRNERPVRVMVWNAPDSSFILYSGEYEPVGEEES